MFVCAFGKTSKDRQSIQERDGSLEELRVHDFPLKWFSQMACHSSLKRKAS